MVLAHLEEGDEVGLRGRLQVSLQACGELLWLDLGILGGWHTQTDTSTSKDTKTHTRTFKMSSTFSKLSRKLYQQILHQALHVLGGVGRRGVLGRQLNQRGQEVLALLHVFHHFL